MLFFSSSVSQGSGVRDWAGRGWGRDAVGLIRVLFFHLTGGVDKWDTSPAFSPFPTLI